MSQEKVDRYKAGKAGRKEEAKKRRSQRILRYVIAIAVLVVICGWLGISMYRNHLESMPRPSVNADITAVSDYEASVTMDQ